MTYQRLVHRTIAQLLEKFDDTFFQTHGILFGGGTRISMELDEYRESVDIDFFCRGADSYRAVRSEVASNGLGSLLRSDQSL